MHSLRQFSAICRQHSANFRVCFSHNHSYAVLVGSKGDLFASPVYRALADSPVIAGDGCEGEGLYYELESL
jgi:hypothetical protein